MSSWRETAFTCTRSLWSENDESLFAGGPPPLAGSSVCASETFRWYLGGLLAHARELAWFFAPTVNSYKRYRPGTFAPTGIAWSYDNRTAGFRVVGSGPSLRVECRIPGADANPYLVYAALLAAGLDGIERKLDPGPVFEGDLYQAEELPRVPHSLPEAIAELERSEFARRSFGDEVIDHLLHFARSEQAWLRIGGDGLRARALLRAGLMGRPLVGVTTYHREIEERPRFYLPSAYVDAVRAAGRFAGTAHAWRGTSGRAARALGRAGLLGGWRPGPDALRGRRSPALLLHL